MKRFALTLMAVALTGALAFADDAAPLTKIEGYLDTGLFLTSDSNNGIQFQAKGNDSGQAYRARIKASQSGANYGVSIGINADKGVFGVDGATAWASPMEGVKISGGTDYSGDVNGVDDKGYGFGNPGVIAVQYSTSGFTGGLIVKAPAVAGPTPVGIGARYAIDKVASFGFETLLSGDKKLDEYALSAKLVAVDKLTLSGGLFSTAVSTTAKTGLDLNVGYNVTDLLSVGALSYYGLSDGAVLTKAGDFWTKPNVTYKLDPKVTLSAYVQYDKTANSNVEPQGEVDFNLTKNLTAKIAGKYDTNAAHTATAVATTTAWVDLIYTF